MILVSGEAPVVVRAHPTKAEQYVLALRDQLLVSGQIPGRDPNDLRRFDLCVESNRYPHGCQTSFNTLIGIAVGPGPNELTLENLDADFGQHSCKCSAEPVHQWAVFGVNPYAPLEVKENNPNPDSSWYSTALYKAVKFFVAGQDPDNHYRADIVELDSNVSHVATSYDKSTHETVSYNPFLVANRILQSGPELRGYVLRDVGGLIAAKTLETIDREIANT